MGKLEILRKKYRRKDLLFVGMGMSSVSIPLKQKKEDLRTYNDFVKHLRDRFFEEHNDNVL